MDENRRLLSDEIRERVQSLKNYDLHGDEMTAATENLERLYKLEIEETKNQRELTERKKERYFKLGIAAGELFIPLIFYAVWMHKGFKFEETGSLTSSTFRSMWSRFRPTCK